MAINNEPTIKPITVTGIFTKYIAKTLPLAFDESMSYYECLCAMLEYLNETIVPDINNTNNGLRELQEFYEELQDYVNHYFDNLDVQQEINTKLDTMAANGQLTALIKGYIDPIYQAYESEINEDIASYKTQINTAVSTLSSQVTSVASGSPKGVYATVSDLTTDDPDHDSIYLVLADGKWYYYDGTDWTAGGTYQSTGVGTNEVDIDNLVENMQTNLNLIIPEITQTSGKFIYKNGLLGDNANGRLSNELHLYTGDIIVFTAKGSGTDVAFIGSYRDDTHDYPLVVCEDSSEVTIAYTVEYEGYYRLSSMNQDIANVKIYRKNISNEYTSEDYVEKTFIDNIICDETYNNITNDKYVRWANGAELDSVNYKVTDYIEIKPKSKIVLETSHKITDTADLSGVAFYDKDEVFISGEQLVTTNKLELTSPNNAKYVRVTITKLMYKNGFNLYYSSLFDLLDNIDTSDIKPINNIFTMYDNITCIGDSLTYSQVYTSANDSRQAYNPYPAILQKLSGTACTNIARPGYTSTNWWNTYENSIVSKTNQLTIIYLGANAGFTDTVDEDVVGSNYQLYANTNTGNYAKIIKKSLDVGSKVLLVKCYASSGNLTTTNSVIEQLATKFNVAVIDNEKLTANKYHYYPDLSGTNSTHYNDLGYQAFTEQLIKNASELSDAMIERIFPE